MTEHKQPQAGEWWISKNNDIVRIVGVKLNGQVVYEMAGGGHSASSGMWPHWHHEPLCTSFDWQPQAPIDPGDGCELLPAGTIREVYDQLSTDKGKTWQSTGSWGTPVTLGSGVIYRRRKPPAETWPKWYVRCKPTLSHIQKRIAYSKMVSENVGTTFHEDGTSYHWSENKPEGWIEVTEAEALARVKPADPLPALIPGIATDRMVDLFLSWRLPSDFQPDGGISFTSRPIHESWPTGTNLFTATQARGMIEHLLSVPEEKSSVKPAEPIDQATKALHELAVDAGIDPLGLYPADIAEKLIAKQQVTGCQVESPDRVPYNRPARDVVMEIVKLLADSSMTDEESADMAFQIGKQWLDDNPEDPPPFAKPFTDPRSGMGIKKEPAHELCQMCGEPAAIPGTGGCRECTQYAIEATQCPVESPDDWVEITDPEHVLREGVDAVFCFKDSIQMITVTQAADRKLKYSGFFKAFCRRRDLPAQRPKRTPVRLWVSHRLISEHGDWPMRCTPADEEFDDGGRSVWKEIKIDGTTLFVEGE